MPDQISEHTAEITIRVYPSGVPGTVMMTADDTGPNRLTTAEAVKILRDAADAVESGGIFGDRWQQ